MMQRMRKKNRKISSFRSVTTSHLLTLNAFLPTLYRILFSLSYIAEAMSH